MLIKAFFSEDIAHLSYMIIGKTQIFVVDPQRFIDIYLAEAKQRDLPITSVLLTHPHADFISGHSELQKTVGAKVYAHYLAPYKTPFIPIKEDETLSLDHIEIKVLETPGHTPFCNSFLLTDHSRGNDPISVFTGDTLFVGDVGRPDLFPEIQEELANKLYDSLFNKIFKLPDFVEVYPAHASGSLCGKNLSEKRATTIGYEKRNNIRAKIKDKQNFVEDILSDNLPVPEHFKYCAKINLKGPQYLSDIPKAEKIYFTDFKHIKEKENPIIIDIRKHWEWINFHVPQSISIDVNCLSFANYAGWIIPNNQPIMIIHDNPSDLSKSINSLRKIGLDQKIYYLDNGIQDLIYQANQFNFTPKILPETVIQSKEKFQLMDVRNGFSGENIFKDFHYKKIKINDIFENKINFDTSLENIILCEKGALATLVLSYIENKKGIPLPYLLGSGRALQKKI